MTNQEVRFISRVVNLGKDRFVLNIPAEFHEEVEKMKGKQVFVSIKNALPS